MASTRLVDVATLELCTFPISQMPPYLAVSHVWSEELFAPSYRNHIQDCEGMKMIQSLSKERPEMSRLKHCWADTWSIDQEDVEDKACQIPLMCDIYKHAQVVVVAVRQPLSFSQADWDLAILNMQEALHYVRRDELFHTPEARACYNSPAVSETLPRAARMAKELARSPWFGRVWTAQEYILAKKLLWIGSNCRSFHISPGDTVSVFEMCALKGEASLFAGFQGMIFMNRIRTRYRHPTAAMQLAAGRECLFPEDEIYGLMAASEVVVTPIYNVGVEVAWQMWWEKAIMAGHIMWAMQVSNSQGSTQHSNCIMPPSAFRFSAFRRCGVPAGVQPYGSVELNEGTISIMGRVAGICNLDTFLGELSGETDGPGFFQDLIPRVSGDWKIVTRVCAAVSAGLGELAAGVSSYAKWACDEYRCRVNDQATQMGERLNVPHFLVSLRCGKTYLGTMKNHFGLVDILVNANEIPNGELLALDIGTSLAKDDTHEESQGYTEFQVLMVVHVPAGLDLARDTVHKVGTTSDIFIPKFDKVRRAKALNGTVLEDNFQRYRIGGTSCSYCHPVQRSETPKSVREKRTVKESRKVQD